MPKRWNVVRIRQELVDKAKKEVERGRYPSLSQFVSEAVRLRLQTLTAEQRFKVSGQLRYTPRHVWIRHTSQGNIKLGVSEYWERLHKGIVNIRSFEEGDKVSENSPFGTIETVAWWPWVVHDVVSPIDGRISEVNKDVLDDPYVLNGNPHQWIVEIQPTDPDDLELGRFLSYEKYRKLVTKALARGVSLESFRWRIKQKARNYVYERKMKRAHVK